MNERYKEPRLNSSVLIVTISGTLEKQKVITKDDTGFTIHSSGVDIKYQYSDYCFTWFSTMDEVKAKYKVFKENNKIYIQEKRYF